MAASDDDFVWLTLGAPDYAFVKVPLHPADVAFDLADRACAKYRSWQLDAAQLRLRLVAGADQPRPQEPSIKAAQLYAPLLVEACALAPAGVARGAWLSAAVVAAGTGGSAPGEAAAQQREGAHPVDTLPSPLAFAEETLGGVLTCVGALEGGRPFFLEPSAHAVLLHYLQQPPFPSPQFLLVSGTVKSGKSRLVLNVIPRMLAQLHQAAAAAAAAAPPASGQLPPPPLRPYPVKVTFRVGEEAEGAAAYLVERLRAAAALHGIPFPAGIAASVANMATVAHAFAQELQQRGLLLWLLLDELGAPLVASPTYAGGLFMQALKALAEQCSTCARLVATGSGMLTLLNAIRTAPVQSFVLLDSAVHLVMGREPPPAQAAAMAQRLVEAYSEHWAPDCAAGARAVITPQRLLALLAVPAQAHLTSPRPALVAYLLDRVRDAWGGSPEELLQDALQSALDKLRVECAGDAAVALERLPHEALVQLRRLAEEDSQVALGSVVGCFEPLGRGLGKVLRGLFEDASPARLMPPYGALVREWVGRAGELAVRRAGDGSVVLHAPVARSLRFLADCRSQVRTAGMEAAVAAAALGQLALNGMGVPAEAAGMSMRVPRTLSELLAIPAIGGLP